MNLEGNKGAKIYRVTPGNFGDDLNEIIIEKYLGEHFRGNVFSNAERKYDVSDDDMLIVAIGTILNLRVPESGRKVVLGAGTGYGQPSVIDDKWDVRFVRGPLTAEKMGLTNKDFITDPAILLADMDIKKPKVTSAIGYVPHHATANKCWESVCQDLNIKYIDPRKTFAEVMQELLSCELIVAEAMHGAIVADTMRIPWIPVSSAEKINVFKWNDWCGSMEMEYHPSSLPSLWEPKEKDYLKRAVTVIKQKQAAMKLKSIIKNSKPVLSKDEVFARKLEQVKQSYADFFNA